MMTGKGSGGVIIADTSILWTKASGTSVGIPRETVGDQNIGNIGAVTNIRCFILGMTFTNDGLHCWMLTAVLEGAATVEIGRDFGIPVEAIENLQRAAEEHLRGF